MDSGNAPQGPPLCMSGCGFFGNPATANMCSKCYKAHAKESSGPGPLAPMVAPPPAPAPVAAPPAASAAAAAAVEAPVAAPAPEAAVPEAMPNRCSTCTKRTGLTGFKCRCGATFCSTHRYADAHNCQFDYKAAAAAQLTKANPAVVASKLDKL